MDDDIVLVFKISNNLVEPRQLTLVSGITPDDEMQKGKRNPELGLPRQNLWILESARSNNDLEIHWQQIKEKISRGNSAKLFPYTRNGEALFTIYVYSEARIPPIRIPIDLMEFAIKINANIDIDHI